VRTFSGSTWSSAKWPLKASNLCSACPVTCILRKETRSVDGPVLAFVNLHWHSSRKLHARLIRRVLHVHLRRLRRLHARYRRWSLPSRRPRLLSHLSSHRRALAGLLLLLLLHVRWH
jgi:hypothetical protein